MHDSLDYLSLRPDEADLVRSLREEMVAGMVRSGAITTEEWRLVFATVPRHPFMPRFFKRDPEGLLHPVDGSRPELRREWLEAAYEINSWVTQLDSLTFEESAARPEVSGEPTSSTTQPDVMAGMLEALRLEDGHHVLEIGTGTGYNAALLTERLGSERERVVTVEVDQHLADAAEQRLSWCGYAPTVVRGDGIRGHAARAPYDRVLATAAVPAIPRAWLEQTRPGGLILANVASSFNAGALVLLTVHGPDHAEGMFLARPAVFFMPVRSAQISGPDRFELLTEAEALGNHPRPTDLSAEALALGGFDFLAALVLRGAARLYVGTDDDQWITWLLDPRDRSTAAISTDGNGSSLVTETGPRRLWTAVEQAHTLWQRTDHPGRDRFGLTIDPDGQRIWLDSPTSPHTWPLADDPPAGPQS